MDDLQVNVSPFSSPVCSPQLLVLKYVQNKDVFMRYHKAHLTRRLILDISADSEIEENMVEWLRVSSAAPGNLHFSPWVKRKINVEITMVS